LIALKARTTTLAHFRHFTLQTFWLQIIRDSCPDQNTLPYLRIHVLGFIGFTEGNVMINSAGLLLEKRLFFNSNNEWLNKKNYLMKLLGLGKEGWQHLR